MTQSTQGPMKSATRKILVKKKEIIAFITQKFVSRLFIEIINKTNKQVRNTHTHIYIYIYI